MRGNVIKGNQHIVNCFSPSDQLLVLLIIYHLFVSLSLVLSVARKQEIIKITEQLIEAINNGDFDAYT